ncbi:MAG: beta-hydroxyacyl-ACP dehydratase [Parasporobacterium sp.]|nr:beta-hydroxyacyl-ACP dehydratase [Parasporobacterium sp.]
MNQEEIKKIMPHRDDMLLLDEAEKVGDEGRGKYLVKGNEFFLNGHFPGNPVVPGVIQCEILAQSVCVLLQDKMEAGKTPMYTGLKNVRFKNPVRPGDLFETRVRITKSSGIFYFAEGEGYVGDTLCVKGEFSFAIVEK